VGGWVILKRVFVFEGEEVKWIGLAQDGDNWIAFFEHSIENISSKQGVCFYYIRK
jgi:hypothetical protein